ncbi:hypothetical protein C900_01488 [Fulvivirga imtechensis AK7]|uniref:Uncharacterized protein n=1 Tax=Fulvivirga imtechensis AK7 TaxID=1237149 RepID=L8JWB3_9BACT|nr:hypothetical protein C900_01488 [Fulvivirga imtechensis AK7]
MTAYPKSNSTIGMENGKSANIRGRIAVPKRAIPMMINHKL